MIAGCNTSMTLTERSRDEWPLILDHPDDNALIAAAAAGSRMGFCHRGAARCDPRSRHDCSWRYVMFWVAGGTRLTGPALGDLGEERARAITRLTNARNVSPAAISPLSCQKNVAMSSAP